MGTGRLEAFSDGVIAILITIMVLEIHRPEGETLDALRPMLPELASYLLSFVFLGIYWNNHHHLLHLAERVNGRVLWANLHLLFWLSLIPVTTSWVGDHPSASAPTATYGAVLLASGVAWLWLDRAIRAVPGQSGRFAAVLTQDWKGPASATLYLLSVGLAFVRPWLAQAIFVTVALIWLVPDRRIEAAIHEDH